MGKLKQKLGRDWSKAVQCEYREHKEDCPNQCAECAIYLKEFGDDVPLAMNELDGAIFFYKSAVFRKPDYVDAWYALGNTYAKKGAYKEALKALNKALSTDETFGDALLKKAMVLQELGRIDEAMETVNNLLELYESDEAETLGNHLIDMGAKSIYTFERATTAMTKKARQIAAENHWLNADDEVSVEDKIYDQKEFPVRVFEYCRKKHASLGGEDFCSECIITSFYASLCTTLLYYQDESGFEDISPFEYLNDHVDLDQVDAVAERMLELGHDTAEAEALWNLIYSYVRFSKDIIAKLETSSVDAAILDAAESAYVLGMLYAMRHNVSQMYNSKEKIDLALEKLAESSKDYVYEPQNRGPACYSLSLPPTVSVVVQCDKCGRTFKMLVYEGEEKLIEKYRLLPKAFIDLGHDAEFMCLCGKCKTEHFPSSVAFGLAEKETLFGAENLVFKIIPNGDGSPIYSFPSDTRYFDFEYRIALAFLQGADTVEKLASATGTELDAETYLRYVRTVLGGEDHEE